MIDNLRAGGKAALARALAQIEAQAETPETAELLDAAWAAPQGWALGLTGPPGVGKSTLTNALIYGLRARGLSVAVLAVDPSSRRSGGALLGDRARIQTDPEDQGVFLRSMAARDRLGGVAELTFPALTLTRALFDMVIVETVGVGQSETEIAEMADAVMFCAQPGSGDALQFMKAGIMETPDIVVVTKADMGAPARRAVADLRGALSLSAVGESVRVLSCAATTGEGMEELVNDLTARRAAALNTTDLSQFRQTALDGWAAGAALARFGREGREVLGESLDRAARSSRPFHQIAALMSQLSRELFQFPRSE